MQCFSTRQQMMVFYLSDAMDYNNIEELDECLRRQRPRVACSLCGRTIRKTNNKEKYCKPCKPIALKNNLEKQRIKKFLERRQKQQQREKLLDQLLYEDVDIQRTYEAQENQ